MKISSHFKLKELKFSAKLKEILRLRKEMDQSQIDNQLFHMFDGSFKAAKDLQVGDQLMGVDSLPCTIQRLDIVDETCYSVKPVKGDPYVVGVSDTLSLSYTSMPFVLWDEGGQKYRVQWFDKAEIKERCTGFSIYKYGSKNAALENAEVYRDSLHIDKKFTLSLVKYLKLGTIKANIKGFKVALNFPDREFLIDPYFIGYWLGDGNQNDSLLTIGEQDNHMVDYFKAYFQNNFNLQFNQVGDSIHYRVTTGESGHTYDGKNVVLKYLRDKNLHMNKHIPLEFLHSSRESRLRLLAGLIDSDGSLDNGNCFDFIQKREQLFNEVVYLVRSLGFSSYKKKCKKTCTNAPGGPKTGDYFRCTISGKGLEEIPNLIPRKRANPREQVKDTLVTGITLENVGIFKNYHIYTDQKEYLLADFTVRHKHEIYFAPLKPK